MSEQTEAITVPGPAAIARPSSPRTLVMAEALREATEQRAILAEYVKFHMMEGVDYGAIPGTPQEVEISIGGVKQKMRKHNLLKSGAEKLFDLFHCRPEYEFISRDVDRESGLYSYEMRCRAINRETGVVLNEGLGSASSFESKYRYRNSERACPQCGKPNIRKSKKGGGWYCWEKTGGCGANFQADDASITDQETGKMINPDLADVANTVLKMAKKRAQVDCAIALARGSDLFTQDIEDLPGADPDESSHSAPPAAPAPPRQSAPAKGKAAGRASAPPAPRDPMTDPPAPRDPMTDRIQKLWEEAKARLGKPTAEARWKEGTLGYVKDRSQWTDDHLVRLACVLFPEEAAADKAAQGAPPPPTSVEEIDRQLADLEDQEPGSGDV